MWRLPGRERRLDEWATEAVSFTPQVVCEVIIIRCSVLKSCHRKIDPGSVYAQPCRGEMPVNARSVFGCGVVARECKLCILPRAPVVARGNRSGASNAEQRQGKCRQACGDGRTRIRPRGAYRHEQPRFPRRSQTNKRMMAVEISGGATIATPVCASFSARVRGSCATASLSWSSSWPVVVRVPPLR